MALNCYSGNRAKFLINQTTAGGKRTKGQDGERVKFRGFSPSVSKDERDCNGTVHACIVPSGE